MSARPRLRPRVAGARRDGFVIGLVVFGGLMFLALAIYPTLFFSGSQTRSEALSANRWRGRVLARSGLKLGASLLRKQRWWDTAEDDDSPSIGTKTSEELAVPASAGRFLLVAESVAGPAPVALDEDQIPDHLKFPDGTARNPLLRVDLFVRATIEDDVAVAYGAFVPSPQPALHGNESVRPGGSARLVRVAYFTGDEYHAIEEEDTRQAIRVAMEARSAAFLTNYAVVDFRATPPNQAVAPMGDAAASSFRDQWLRTPASSPRTAYLRDRIFDVLFEGTPTRRRGDARQDRVLEADLEACSGEALEVIAEAQWFCANDMEGDCTWYDPACLTPREWDYAAEDAPGDDTVLHLREQDLDDSTLDLQYINRMSQTEPILRKYKYDCDVVEFLDRPPQPSDPDEFWPPRPAPSGPGQNLPAAFWPDFCPAGDPNDQCFCVNVQGQVEDPPSGTVAYQLEDPVTGYQQNLREVASYFERQLLEFGDVIGSDRVTYQRYRTGEVPPTPTPTPTVPIDDDGDQDDDGTPDESDPDYVPPPTPSPPPTPPPPSGGSGSFGGGGTF